MDTVTAPHKTIRCVHCGGVFGHVRQYVAHLKQRGVDEPSECDQIRRGLV